jgi:cytidine deaminase
MSDEQLINAAADTRENAYAPYSKFQVGAALLGIDGEVYTGANVENSSYGLTVCAERVAVFNAISAGCKSFVKLAIVSGSSPPVTPCGACRQVLYEFAPDLLIICTNDKNEVNTFSLSQLFPEGFRLK